MGLLVQLDGAIEGLQLDSIVSGPVAQLGGLGSVVSALVSGPSELGALTSSLSNPPAPEGLSGLGGLGAGLGELNGALPTDLGAVFEPLLVPLRDLSGLSITGSTTVSVTAAFDLFRQIGELVTERFSRGAQPFPGLFAEDSVIDFDAVHTAFGEFETALDDFGARLDAAKLIELMRQAAGPWLKAQAKQPPFPVLAEVMESLATIQRWESMTPEQLTRSLRTTLDQAAVLIATPRTRVAKPVIEAATLAADAPGILTSVDRELTPAFERLGHVVRRGSLPSATDLLLVEQKLDGLERLCRAIDLENGPLFGFRTLPLRLEQQLIRVVRALHGAYEGKQVETFVRGLLDAIPAANPDPLAPVVSVIEDFDLGAITGPLGEVRAAVEDALTAIDQAFATVESALRDALTPLREGLDALVSAIQLEQVRAALEDLPATIGGFVENDVQPALESLRSAIDAAVSQVSAAVDLFDPEAIKDQVEAAVRTVTDVLSVPEVMGPLQEVTHALQGVAEAVRGFDLTPAADSSISIMGDVESALSAIDPAIVPDAAKPMLRQAVDAVTNISISAEVGDPLLDAVQGALNEGPVALLREVDGALGELKTRLDSFRPSQLVGDNIEAPFQEILTTLDGFRPSQLLEQVEGAMAEMRAHIHVVDPDELLGPLEQTYSVLSDGLASIEPETLLEPVRATLQEAIDHVMEISGLDQAFEGLTSILQEVRSAIDLADRMRASLEGLASKLEAPGDIESALTAVVEGTVQRLDPVDLAALIPAFTACAESTASIGRDRLTSELAIVLRRASDHTPAALAPGARRLEALADGFPVAVLGASPQAPERQRLMRSLVRLRGVIRHLEAAVDPWHEASSDMGRLAEQLYARLEDYNKLMRLEGDDVFAGFRDAPADNEAVKDSVREALRDGLRLPTSIVFSVFAALSPHVAGWARGFSRIIGALHDKFDDVLGEDGVAGIVDSLDDVVERLRTVDLTPITDPLGELHGDLGDKLALLDPAPLRDVLEAVRAALDGLLRVTSLIDPSTIRSIDETYASAVDRLRQLSPRRLLIDTVDPVYEELLADILPAFELVTELRSFFENTTAELRVEIEVELDRVEVAFDRMLRAIPLDGSSGSAGVSASANASVSLG